MKKIPTLFRRNPADPSRVFPEVSPGCEWVLAGEGVPTRKYDGTCCYYDGVAWWARREAKPNKAPPEGFVRVEYDPTTAKTVGWVPMAGSPFERWHAAAIEGEGRDGDDPPLRAGTYELCGPRINGNPEGLQQHVLIAHDAALTLPLQLGLSDAQSFYAAIERFLRTHAPSVEGIVWHHPDGRMAKIKARDFGIKRASP